MAQIKKITVVGGGSAGWMTAATLIKFFPNHTVTVIESSTIPTVGVGESTLGGIRFWMSALGINEEDFMKYTNASYKMSIKFTDFYEKDYGSFHYPFSKPYIDESSTGLNDWQVKKILYPETPVEDYCRTYYPAMSLIEQNKFTKDSKNLENFRHDIDVAYHFDAALFGKWLKEHYCLPKGVIHIDDVVNTIQQDEDGITSLTLENGGDISADLYIDCTGWKSLLLDKTLNEPFESYSHILPNNRAWAVQIPYTNKEKELEPFTNCTAIDNGWVWNIPLWSRIGTGYVYSDKHISPEGALQQFKDYLNSDKMTVPNKNRVTDDLIFRDVSMRIGLHKRTWVKNVVAIGLSAGFIEPLESNGLFTVHEFLLNLVSVLQRGHGTQWDRDTYNTATKSLFDNFAEFVSLHYALSVRDDTPYWKDIKNKCVSPEMVALKPILTNGFTDLVRRKMSMFGHDHNGGMHCIATGMNYFVFNNLNMLYNEKLNNININDHFNYWQENRKQLIKKWNYTAKTAPTLFEYLKENIHDHN
tara:strand:- start:20726 stop:22312 length:1587 start_codon:yes stop_codon:yes gene_type:complete